MNLYPDNSEAGPTFIFAHATDSEVSTTCPVAFAAPLELSGQLGPLNALAGLGQERRGGLARSCGLSLLGHSSAARADAAAMRGPFAIIRSPSTGPDSDDIPQRGASTTLRISGANFSRHLLRAMALGGAHMQHWTPCGPVWIYGGAPNQGHAVGLRAPEGATAAASPEFGPAAKLDALMLDILIVLLTRLTAQPSGCVLSPRVIAEAKDYRRWGQERLAFHARIADRLRRLDQLILYRDGEERPLFHLSPRNVARTDFLIRPGAGFETSAPAGERDIILSSRILALDHRQNRGTDALAKKLAMLFALEPASLSAPIDSVLHKVIDSQQRPEENLGPRFARVLRAVLCRLSEHGMQPNLRWETFLEPHARPGNSRPTIPETPPDEQSRTREQRRRGRPPFSPTDQQRLLVQSLTCGGFTREEIAERLKVSVPTLRRYFRAELSRAEESALQKACAPATS